jgi:hypothetical protein
MHVGHDPVHVPRRVRAQVEHGHLLLLLVQRADPAHVVLQRVRSKDRHLARAVRLDVLR